MSGFCSPSRGALTIIDAYDKIKYMVPFSFGEMYMVGCNKGTVYRFASSISGVEVLPVMSNMS